MTQTLHLSIVTPTHLSLSLSTLTSEVDFFPRGGMGREEGGSDRGKGTDRQTDRCVTAAASPQSNFSSFQVPDRQK